MKKFDYTYKAPTEEERKEAEAFRRKYQKEEKNSGVERLRYLDGLVNTVPMIISLTFGVIGTLIFGLGLTMVLEWSLYLWGVITSAVGFIVLIVAYPIYSIAHKRNEEKYRDEILKIAAEILNENES